MTSTRKARPVILSFALVALVVLAVGVIFPQPALAQQDRIPDGPEGWTVVLTESGPADQWSIFQDEGLYEGEKHGRDDLKDFSGYMVGWQGPRGQGLIVNVFDTKSEDSASKALGGALERIEARSLASCSWTPTFTAEQRCALDSGESIEWVGWLSNETAVTVLGVGVSPAEMQAMVGAQADLIPVTAVFDSAPSTDPSYLAGSLLVPALIIGGLVKASNSYTRSRYERRNFQF